MSKVKAVVPSNVWSGVVRIWRTAVIVVDRVVIEEATVVRHRCHNARCVRPEHMIEGSETDNKRGDWDD
ncbi:MAG: hypothetical protein ACWA49_14835 [Ruegeria sp.]